MLVKKVRDLLYEKFSKDGFFVISDYNYKVIWCSEGADCIRATDLLKSRVKGRLCSICTYENIVLVPVSEDFLIYAESDGVIFDRQNCDSLILLCDMILDELKGNADTRILSGNSSIIKGILEDAGRYSTCPYPILLTGESGAGKSRLASFIHKQSKREGQLVKENCPNIPEELFESILFGHKKGAFTGAVTDRPGLIEEADRGTLFLDEITEISLQFQSKLLTFIEEGRYRRLGDAREKFADVRIVAATNRNLEEEIREGRFREDLYYRLCVLEIKIPPLRERLEDIRVLVEDNRKLLMGKPVDDSGIEAMMGYSWTGNVRELLNFLIRLGVGEYEVVDKVAVLKELQKSIGRDKPEREESALHLWSSFKAGESFWDVVKEPYLKRDLNREQVLRCIQDGLGRTKGVYKKLLGIYNLPESDYKRFMNFLHTHKFTRCSDDETVCENQVTN